MFTGDDSGEDPSLPREFGTIHLLAGTDPATSSESTSVTRAPVQSQRMISSIGEGHSQI